MKAITFDFWGTLMVEGPNYAAQVLPERYEILLAASDEAGVPAGEAEVRDAWSQATRKFNDAWRAGVFMGLEDRVAYAFKLLGVRYDPDLVRRTAQALAETGRDADLVVRPGVREALPELARHYRLAIVSDTGVSGGTMLRHYLDREGLLPYFSAFSFSDETRVFKPDPRAFLTALEALGVEPSAALHTGDHPRTDIAGARRTGYRHAVLFEGDHADEPGPEPTARIRDHRELLQLVQRLEPAP
ncbi:HAD family hydrolase [Deinococcota bacterium DY0809b]